MAVVASAIEVDPGRFPEPVLRALPDTGWPDSDPDFDDLYRRFHARVAALVRRRVVDHHRQQDIVQEVFLRAWRALPTLQTDRPTWPWLATIASNTCADALRPRYVRAEELVGEADVCSLMASAPSQITSADDPADLFWDQERRRTVVDALCALPPRQQRVLVLKDSEGWSCADIAGAEGLSLEATKGLLKRARVSFRSTYSALATDRGLLSGLSLGGLVPALRRLRARIARTVSDRYESPQWATLGQLINSYAIPLAAAGVISLGSLSQMAAAATVPNQARVTGVGASGAPPAQATSSTSTQSAPEFSGGTPGVTSASKSIIVGPASAGAGLKHSIGGDTLGVAVDLHAGGARVFLHNSTGVPCQGNPVRTASCAVAQTISAAASN